LLGEFCDLRRCTGEVYIGPKHAIITPSPMGSGLNRGPTLQGKNVHRPEKHTGRPGTGPGDFHDMKPKLSLVIGFVTPAAAGADRAHMTARERALREELARVVSSLAAEKQRRELAEAQVEQLQAQLDAMRGVRQSLGVEPSL